MSALTIEEKLDLVKNLCDKHKITAYEIGDHTELNASGVHKILTGSVKKPRNKTLNIILQYIENKIVGTNLDYKKPEKRADSINDEKDEYQVRRFEDIVADKVLERLEPFLLKINQNHQQSRDILELQKLMLDKLMDQVKEVKNITEKTFQKVSKD